MAHKKRESDYSDDEVSVTSSTSHNSEGHDARGIEDLLEDLTNKRSATRVTALKEISKQLREKFLFDFVQSRRDTLQSYLEGCIRKGSGEEVRLAALTLGLVVATLGPDSHSFLELMPKLETFVKNPAKAGELRAAVVEAVGVMYFAGSDEDEGLRSCRALLNTLWAQGLDANRELGGPDLTASALQSWALLLTVLPNTTLANEYLPKYKEQLKQLLKHKSLDVRAAAGETLALLFSAHVEALREAADAEDGDDDHDVEKQRSPEESAEVEEVVALVEKLATDGAKSKSKRERRQQRSVFRDVLKTFEESEVPVEKLTIGKHRVEVEGWQSILQLTVFRTIFETGLQTHLKENDFLMEVFAVEPQPDELDESDQRGKSRKARALEYKSRFKESQLWRHGQRKSKHHHRHHHEHDD